MIFVWRGWGWLVPAGTFACLLITQVTVEGLGGTYSGSDFWPGAALVLGGLANVSLGRRFNSRPARTLIDADTNERIEVKPRHDFFFIRMEWWGAAIAAGGMAYLVVGAFSP